MEQTELPLYTPAWWAATYTWVNAWRSRILMLAFAYFGVPKSFIDIGCGDGTLPILAHQLGAEPAMGVDIALPANVYKGYYLCQHDLTTPFHVQDQFDLATSWETAEHLPESAADTFIDTVANSCSNRLLFSAAVPGQGGIGHINEQKPEYWIDKLRQRGMRLDIVENERLKRALTESVYGPAWWYRNIMVFKRA